MAPGTQTRLRYRKPGNDGARESERSGGTSTAGTEAGVAVATEIEVAVRSGDTSGGTMSARGVAVVTEIEAAVRGGDTRGGVTSARGVGVLGGTNEGMSVDHGWRSDRGAEIKKGDEGIARFPAKDAMCGAKTVASAEASAKINSDETEAGH